MLKKIKKIFYMLIDPQPELTWEHEATLYDWVRCLNERIDRVEDNQVFLRGEILRLEKKIDELYNK